MSLDPLLNLSSVLDRIDSQKKPKLGQASALAQPLAVSSSYAPVSNSKTDNKDAKSDSKELSVDTAKQTDVWYEFIDPSSGKSYYHNYVSQQTSWEKPETFIPFAAPPPAAAVLTNSIPLANSTSSAADYRVVGFFNQNNGRFTGNQSYWDQVSDTYSSSLFPSYSVLYLNHLIAVIGGKTKR